MRSGIGSGGSAAGSGEMTRIASTIGRARPRSAEAPAEMTTGTSVTEGAGIVPAPLAKTTRTTSGEGGIDTTVTAASSPALPLILTTTKTPSGDDAGIGIATQERDDLEVVNATAIGLAQMTRTVSARDVLGTRSAGERSRHPTQNDRTMKTSIRRGRGINHLLLPSRLPQDTTVSNMRSIPRNGEEIVTKMLQIRLVNEHARPLVMQLPARAPLDPHFLTKKKR